MIKVEHLSKSYGEKKVIYDLNVAVEKGKVFGLLGSNGAGKSTSIECILGTKKADSGKVTMFQKNPWTERKTLFQKIGVQFQESNYQREIRVDELCEETESLYSQTKEWRKLLKQFGISNKVKSFVKDLSGGERQRLFIVLALIPDPEIVFLDEITTGLDVKARREVWKRLENLKKDGLTIFMTSHFMDEVEILCDKICILKDGKSAFYGTPEQAIKNSPYDKLEDAYLWYTGEEDDFDENF